MILPREDTIPRIGYHSVNRILWDRIPPIGYHPQDRIPPIGYPWDRIPPQGWDRVPAPAYRAFQETDSWAHPAWDSESIAVTCPVLKQCESHPSASLSGQLPGEGCREFEAGGCLSEKEDARITCVTCTGLQGTLASASSHHQGRGETVTSPLSLDKGLI